MIYIQVSSSYLQSSRAPHSKAHMLATFVDSRGEPGLACSRWEGTAERTTVGIDENETRSERAGAVDRNLETSWCSGKLARAQKSRSARIRLRKLTGQRSKRIAQLTKSLPSTISRLSRASSFRFTSSCWPLRSGRGSSAGQRAAPSAPASLLAHKPDRPRVRRITGDRLSLPTAPAKSRQDTRIEQLTSSLILGLALLAHFRDGCFGVDGSIASRAFVAEPFSCGAEGRKDAPRKVSSARRKGRRVASPSGTP